MNKEMTGKSMEDKNQVTNQTSSGSGPGKISLFSLNQLAVI
jgi:hypothetical protein